MRYAAVCLVVLLAACSGSSESDGGTDGGANTPTDGGSTVYGGTDAGPMDAGCDQNCANENPAAYQEFAQLLLQSCGCMAMADGGPAACESACSSTCTTPSSLSLESACGECLLMKAEGAAGDAGTPPCVESAGESCIANSTCSPFVTCELTKCGL